MAIKESNEDQIQNSNAVVDILIVGGGHAGLEAACLASQFDLKVLIVTMPDVPLASAPCNPAIGGVGKGQVVREIDALGGLMGMLADQAAIQYRTLNTSKGYAVQSTRVQIDKEIYSKKAEEWARSIKNLEIFRDRIDSIEKTSEFFAVKSKSGKSWLSRKVILTTGTFLNGKLHAGKEMISGGRRGCESSLGLKSIFSKIKVLPVRFKTGTPPRLKKSTINFAVMEEQESDPQTRNFHCLHSEYERICPQVSCYLTKTNQLTLDIIRENRNQSPIFNGQIQGIGPRYCPSIEDKAHRYPDRNSHHIFVEPEGLDLDTFYPNGISTSLPVSVQEEFIQTIAGLESAEIAIPGYAVEYDVVDTTRLNNCLEHVDIHGIYFAGQVNGTSGYEEAAGQGLIAGLNAALSVLGRPPIVLNRYDSYIGVMIEDLISNRRDEPYRLFTARSENRLSIREDNTLNRMYPYRKLMKLSCKLDQFYEDYIHEYEILSELCVKTQYSCNEKDKEYFNKNGYGEISCQSITLADLLKQADLNPIEVLTKECMNFKVKFMSLVIQSVAITKKYEGYIMRMDQQNKKILKLDSMKINWEELSKSKNISYECKQRIIQVRPQTFGQLRIMEGIRPATLAIVAGKLY